MDRNSWGESQTSRIITYKWKNSTHIILARGEFQQSRHGLATARQRGRLASLRSDPLERPEKGGQPHRETRPKSEAQLAALVLELDNRLVDHLEQRLDVGFLETGESHAQIVGTDRDQTDAVAFQQVDPQRLGVDPLDP